MKSPHRAVSLSVAITAAVFSVAIIVAGCSNLSSGTAQTASPSFSLVGYPNDRPVDLVLRVSGPGMDPIFRRVRGDDGELTLEVPAGRNRIFDFRASNDIYSGQVTTAIAPDSTIRLRVPIFPGPVYVDFAGGQAEGQVVQIRDIHVAGSAVSDPENGLARRWPLDTDANGFLANPVDAAFDENGRLWVATAGGGQVLSPPIYRTPTLAEYSDRSFSFLDPELEEILESTPVSALAIDRSRGRVYFSHGPKVNAMTTQGEFITRFEVTFGEGRDGTSVTQVSDMTVDHEGNLHVLAVGTITTTRQRSPEDAVLLAKISGRDASVLKAPAAIPLTTDIPDYEALSILPPVGAITARGENLVLAVATVPPAGREEYPPIALLDTNHRLLRTWGTKTESTRTAPGEFWGPRRFLANRHGGPFLVIDQMDGTDQANGIGRIVSFTPGTTDGWNVL
ncbi:MAG: hypothetical protein ACOCZ9_03275, partial [Spirochaetota bacterium]